MYSNLINSVQLVTREGQRWRVDGFKGYLEDKFLRLTYVLVGEGLGEEVSVMDFWLEKDEWWCLQGGIQGVNKEETDHEFSFVPARHSRRDLKYAVRCIGLGLRGESWAGLQVTTEAVSIDEVVLKSTARRAYMWLRKRQQQQQKRLLEESVSKRGNEMSSLTSVFRLYRRERELLGFQLES